MALVFGYGSLVAQSARPALLTGWRRVWGVAMDNAQDIAGYKHFEAPDGTRPAVWVAFLDVERCSDGEVPGAVVEVDEAQLAALDLRERNYVRIRVETDRGPAWTYVGSGAGRARLAAGRAAGRVVLSSQYLRRVRAGCEQLNIPFDDSTGPVPGPVAELGVVAHRPLTEGEEWTRRALEDLRARRFSPPAVGAFLLASQRRAAAMRAARPELGRQSRRWVATGAAGWLALAVAGVEPFRRRTVAGLAWWSACAAMVDWHLGMVETEDGRPRGLGAADAVTLARAWLVPVAWDSAPPAASLAAVASDGLDGWLARCSEPTRAGRDLEGLVDVCFAGAALRGARRVGGLGAPAARAEVTRLAAGFAYSLAVYFGRAEPPEAGLTRAARATTPLRAAGLIAAGTRRRGWADALTGGSAVVSVAILGAAIRRSGQGRSA